MFGEISAGELTIRLVLAAVLSGLIGFERETRQKAAGLRTHMLVGLGAALFTVLSATAFDGGDPSRVAAQIVSGIGFLGAGAIFREGATVRGLTTAAGLWAVAAIGMTTGAGLLMASVLATVIAFAILWGLGVAEDLMRRRRGLPGIRSVGVRVSDLSELDELISIARSLDPSSTNVSIREVEGNTVVSIQVDEGRVDSVIRGLTGLETVAEAVEQDPF